MGDAVVMKFRSETSKTVWYNCLSRCQARYLYSSPPFWILIPPKALYSYLFSPAPYCYCAGESYSGWAPEECALCALAAIYREGARGGDTASASRQASLLPKYAFYIASNPSGVLCTIEEWGQTNHPGQLTSRLKVTLTLKATFKFWVRRRALEG